MKNKPDLIIFTGVDCTGKSTIAKYVSNKLEIPLKSPIKPKSEQEGKLSNYDLLNKIKSDTILDRYYIEEVVYAPIYRGYKADYIKELEQQLINNFNIVLVYTYASTDVIKQRFDTRGEDSTRKEDIEQLKINYCDFLHGSLITKRVVVNTSYDLTESDYEDILYNIKCNLN